MSAFICSDYHINSIVSYFLQSPRQQDQLWAELDGEWQYIKLDNAKLLGEILARENRRSVNARYSENEPCDYQWQYVRREHTLAEIAGALDCLEYQSCECEDYRQSQAYSIICLMRKHLLRQVMELEGVESWELNEELEGER